MANQYRRHERSRWNNAETSTKDPEKSNDLRRKAAADDKITAADDKITTADDNNAATRLLCKIFRVGKAHVFSLHSIKLKYFDKSVYLGMEGSCFWPTPIMKESSKEKGIYQRKEKDKNVQKRIQYKSK